MMKKIAIVVFGLLICLATNGFSETNHTDFASIEFGDITPTNAMYTAETIDEFIHMTMYGVTNADGEYIAYTNANHIWFDKDSGFTVSKTNENGILVSLGSAWTWLYPDFEKIYSIVYTNDDIVYTNYYTNSALRPSGEEALSIKVVQTNETGTFWGPNTNKNEKTFYIGLDEDVDYEHVIVSDDITVFGIPYQIGKYTNGAIISSGTTLKTVFNNIFKRTLPPTYKTPNLDVNISGITGNTTYEYGTLFLNPTITATIQTNNGGNPEYYLYYINAYPVASNATTATTDSYNMDSFNIVGTMTFDVRCKYGQGEILPDSDGNPYPDGRIEENIIAEEQSIIASRYMFYGSKIDEVSVDNTNSIIHNFNSMFVSNLNNKQLSINNLPIGTSQVVIAFPQHQLILNSIIFKSALGNSDITSESRITYIDNFYCLNGWSDNGDNGNSYIIYNYKMQKPISNTGNDIIFNFQ